MNRKHDVKELHRLVDMVLETKLVALKHSAEQIQQTQRKIAGLAIAPTMIDAETGLPEVLAALQFQTWADSRRAELIGILASQTATWLDARDNARFVFAKSQGLRQIVETKFAQQRR